MDVVHNTSSLSSVAAWFPFRLANVKGQLTEQHVPRELHVCEATLGFVCCAQCTGSLDASDMRLDRVKLREHLLSPGKSYRSPVCDQRKISLINKLTVVLTLWC